MCVIIYHNPRCSKSRATLGILQEKGIDLQIVEYLKHPLDREVLAELLSSLGMDVRELIRRGEKIYKELNSEDSLSDDELVDLMVQHPILMNRPIVVSSKGARLCRPPETVLEIL